MKKIWLLLLVVIVVSAVSVPLIYVHNQSRAVPPSSPNGEFFFGVSFGGTTASQAKLLIDKVKGYTNFFLINSWDIATNETALDEISHYAVDNNLHFMVFFDYISRFIYPWHQTWLDTAKARFGDNFLGVYLYDEPGGRQIETGRWDAIFIDASDYSEAAEKFVTTIPESDSVQDLKSRNITMFTSDFALYWFDYLAGYDTIFVELGWNHSVPKHIGLCRGAATVQNKDWGAIIVWKAIDPEDDEKGIYKTGPEMLQDMKTAYQAGAKYVIIFDYPYEGTYGILEDEHFDAMETFWNLAHSGSLEKVEAEVAFVLPKDYGWGMRTLEDRIWLPDWGPDSRSTLIWDNLNKLIDRYGLRLDIIYDDPSFDFAEKYSEIYYWNSQIP